MKDIVKFDLIIIVLLAIYSCSAIEKGSSKVEIELVQDNNVVAGQNLLLNYRSNSSYNKVLVSLMSTGLDEPVEVYSLQDYTGYYTINRFLNKDISHYEDYYLAIDFLGEEYKESTIIDVSIQPSIIIESFCSSPDCNRLSGNIVQNTVNRLSLKMFKIAPIKIEYTITTPYSTFQVDHEFNTPVDEDWLDNLSFNSVPRKYSSYINTIVIRAYDIDGNVAETALPFKVVRPIEIKHFGEYELAETYEPVPVTGCIPGSIGNNVQYTESQSETRQNSVSITISNNWNNSNSSAVNVTNAEGVSVSETANTILSSSLATSESISESENYTATNNESSNIVFSSNDGENWSWDIGESETQGSGSSNTQGTNVGVNGSVTTGFSGEGSLPFLAKVSGKVEVTAGVSAGLNSANTESESEANTTSRGYSTGGSSQNGRSYGTATNNARSHSLSGAYVLSSSTSNTITEASGTSSGRIWNMSESVSSGKTVTEGSSESLSETIVDSSTSSTTFSYSAYIPRGRYGIFYRQTSRYVKLSEVITYSLDGVAYHAGYVSMNSWAWAPELSIGNDCNDMPTPNLPEAVCHIPPCGE